MPDIKAPQQHWEDWFQRIGALPIMYKGIPASIVVPALITNVRADDARIYGWQETILNADQKGQTLGLTDFLTHVKKLVIPTGVARKEAAQELKQKNHHVLMTVKRLVLKYRKFLGTCFLGIQRKANPYPD